MPKGYDASVVFRLHFLSVVSATVNLSVGLPAGSRRFRVPLQFISSTKIAITKAGSKEGAPPIPWRAEPGPIVIVGVNTEGCTVQLERPATVAVVREDVDVEENESLHVYQSAKEIRVNGGGFGDNISVREPRCSRGSVCGATPHVKLRKVVVRYTLFRLLLSA